MINTNLVPCGFVNHLGEAVSLEEIKEKHPKKKRPKKEYRETHNGWIVRGLPINAEKKQKLRLKSFSTFDNAMDAKRFSESQGWTDCEIIELVR